MTIPKLRVNQTQCTAEGCTRLQRAKGGCAYHYQVWRSDAVPKKKRPNGTAYRYIQEVVLAYEGDECLIWPFVRNPDGYAQFWRDGRSRGVHPFVCDRTHGPKPTPRHEAAHSCGKGRQGCVTKGHLSWKTHAENMADKITHGTQLRGSQISWARLTETDVSKIKRDLKRGVRVSDLARQYGMDMTTISSIKAGLSWKHVS